MATVHIPAAMRNLTQGEAEIVAEGATLGAVIESLDAAYPGLKSRLAEGERLRMGLAAFVNGVNVPASLATKIPAEADIYFVPAISGG